MAGTISIDSDFALHRREHFVWRRLLVFSLCAASWAALGCVAARMLGEDLLSLRGLAVILFLLGLPWTLLTSWNAVIGFLILRFTRDPAAFANAAIARAQNTATLTTRTAICVAIRHEDVTAVFSRFEALIESLLPASVPAVFSFHVLSDSADPAVCAAEEAAFAATKLRFGPALPLFYRRRSANTGFKAGNIYEFATNAGRDYDFMLVLDADSMMSAEAVLRLARIMQANPRLGILQTLAVGRPSGYAFTRLFQFGMRNGMRTHALGLAWWQGTSGPYWGHNAIIRVAAFAAHCRLPVIPGRGPLSGHVLSHDQVEAALMCRAGYEVRLIAEEFGSWEENPPDLPCFIKRDLRWCQGNLQYLKLLGRVSLAPMGVFQLVNAIMMYLGSVFWIALLMVGLAIAVTSPSGHSGLQISFSIYLFMFAFGFLPRLLGVLDIMLTPGRSRYYGGVMRLLASTLADAGFSILLGTLMAVAQAIFIGGLAFGRRIIWEPQRRASAGLSFSQAMRQLWPQTIFGVIMGALLGWFAPVALIGASPTLASCLLSVPFAVATASSSLGRVIRNAGLCATPEEFDNTSSHR